MKRTQSYLVSLTILQGSLAPAWAEEPNLQPVSVIVTDSQTRDQRWLLSGLWAFATLNYLYCDVVGLMDARLLAQYSSGTVNGMKMSEGFLLASTLLMEIPMSMALLSSMLPPKALRIANIATGVLMTLVQGASIAAAKPTSYYLASSIVEIATTAFIAIYSSFFFKLPDVIPTMSATKDSMSAGARFMF